MGFRFRKSTNLGPFRLNFSKSGIGWSVGVPGFRYTKKANGGTRVTTSIPGTGISHVQETGKKKHEEQRAQVDKKPTSPGVYKVCGIIALALAFFSDMIAGVGAAVSVPVCITFLMFTAIMAFLGIVWVDVPARACGEQTSARRKIIIVALLAVVFAMFAALGAGAQA